MGSILKDMYMYKYNSTIKDGDFKEIIVESFWGAIASILLLQIFGFITFQAFLSYLNFIPFLLFGVIWLLVFMLMDALTMNKIKQYLSEKDTKLIINSLNQKDDFFKFCLAILFVTILVLFFLGYYPFPKIEYSILTLFGFYIFSWIASFFISYVIKKTTSSIRITKNPYGLLFGLSIGVIFLLVSYFIATDMFYLHGMIGIGVCIMIINSWLLEDQIK